MNNQAPAQPCGQYADTSSEPVASVTPLPHTRHREVAESGRVYDSIVELAPNPDNPTPMATQPPPTEPPATFTPTEPAPEPTDTPLATIAPRTATPEPVLADNTAVVQVNTPTAATDSTAPDEPGGGATPIKPVADVNFGRETSAQEEGPNQNFLFIGAILLLVALALVVGAIVIWRRSNPQ